MNCIKTQKRGYLCRRKFSSSIKIIMKLKIPIIKQKHLGVLHTIISIA